jgi:hypothetical protein
MLLMSSGALISCSIDCCISNSGRASRYPALTNTTATVLLSGHYDSRGSFGMTRAPGGNDDGSGTISILSIARAISKRGILFHSNVELVAFAGEEQGLLGSRAYASKHSHGSIIRTRFMSAPRGVEGCRCQYHTHDSSGHACLP